MFEIIAVIVAPILAVLIGQYLQNRAEKRKDKMQIFRILMTSRIYGWTIDSVHALNLIDVVFVKDIRVREAWKKLLDAYSSAEQSDLMNKKRQDCMYKLIEEIAISLGYKDRITWENIQNPYVPQGLIDQWDEQTQSQHVYNQLLHGMKDMLPNTPRKEETKHGK